MFEVEQKFAVADFADIESRLRERGIAVDWYTKLQALDGAACALAVAPLGFARSEHPAIGLVAVGFDGGVESKHALASAAELAERLDSDLRVVVARPSALEFDSRRGPARAPSARETFRRGPEIVAARR